MAAIKIVVASQQSVLPAASAADNLPIVCDKRCARKDQKRDNRNGNCRRRCFFGTIATCHSARLSSALLSSALFCLSVCWQASSLRRLEAHYTCAVVRAPLSMCVSNNTKLHHSFSVCVRPCGRARFSVSILITHTSWLAGTTNGCSLCDGVCVCVCLRAYRHGHCAAHRGPCAAIGDKADLSDTRAATDNKHNGIDE